jgi:hypothetical protein
MPLSCLLKPQHHTTSAEKRPSTMKQRAINCLSVSLKSHQISRPQFILRSWRITKMNGRERTSHVRQNTSLLVHHIGPQRQCRRPPVVAGGISRQGCLGSPKYGSQSRRCPAEQDYRMTRRPLYEKSSCPHQRISSLARPPGSRPLTAPARAVEWSFFEEITPARAIGASSPSRRNVPLASGGACPQRWNTAHCAVSRSCPAGDAHLGWRRITQRCASTSAGDEAISASRSPAVPAKGQRALRVHSRREEQ